MNRVLLALTIVVISTLPTQAATVCENPVFIIEPGSDILRLHQIFDAGEASHRWFTEVHYLRGDPNLTVGMGHWTRGKLAKLFQEFRQDPDTWKELTNTWANTMTPDMWLSFEKDTGEKGRNADAISRGLEQRLCVKDASKKCVESKLLPWSHATKDRFNSRSHWFHAGWRAVSVLRPVAEHQVRYWAKSEVSAGQKAASKRDIVTLGGIAIVISAESSGLGTTMFDPGVQVAKASFQETKFEWPLHTVPEAVRPLGGAVNERTLLEDWKSLVAWQYYTVKKGRVRSRAQAIWRAFYESTWGPLPSNLTIPDLRTLPQHSGCYMARGQFDIASAIRAPSILDCTASIPHAGPVPCVPNP
jgi:hypothetical protein